jgi:hypothetical protein
MSEIKTVCFLATILTFLLFMVQQQEQKRKEFYKIQIEKLNTEIIQLKKECK